MYMLLERTQADDQRACQALGVLHGTAGARADEAAEAGGRDVTA